MVCCSRQNNTGPQLAHLNAGNLRCNGAIKLEWNKTCRTHKRFSIPNGLAQFGQGFAPNPRKGIPPNILARNTAFSPNIVLRRIYIRGSSGGTNEREKSIASFFPAPALASAGTSGRSRCGQTRCRKNPASGVERANIGSPGIDRSTIRCGDSFRDFPRRPGRRDLGMVFRPAKIDPGRRCRPTAATAQRRFLGDGSATTIARV